MDVPLVLEFVGYRLVMWSYINKDCLSAVNPVAMAKDGEVFVLNMGDPVKIVDLAQRMIQLSGHEVKDEHHTDGDIEIVFTGLRPGEKLYEELIIGEDNVQDTDHPLIMQAMEHCFALADIEATLCQLTDRAEEHDVAWLKQQFTHFVAGYQDGTPTIETTHNSDNTSTNTSTNTSINKSTKQTVRTLESAME